jgi:hypothetical protein
MIEFRMVGSPTQRATSAVDNQGRFTLQFADTNARFVGAQPGEYDVAVYPTGSVTMEPVPATQRVTVGPAGTTDLKITLIEAP